MTPLCTIGYEGCSADEWLELLVASRVEIIVDVREMPLSRKPGFSKTRLAEMLRSKGIDYVHLRSLGNPKAHRDRLRDGWDFVEFADEYRRILDAQPVCPRRPSSPRDAQENLPRMLRRRPGRLPQKHRRRVHFRVASRVADQPPKACLVACALSSPSGPTPTRPRSATRPSAPPVSIWTPTGSSPEQ